MKKLISMILFVCLLGNLVPAAAESAVEDAPVEAEEPDIEPAAGCNFDFILRLHPEALAGSLARQAEGYADLLESLRFHGSYIWSLGLPGFELNLSIIPVDSRGDPITVRLHGAEDLMFLNSSLLGEKTITLSNYSLLNFSSKMSEHLGVPLQYIALLLPYVWANSLFLPIQDWNYMLEGMDENGVIPEKAVRYLWDCWWYRVNEDEGVRILVDSLCKDSDLEEAFRGMVMEIPDYFVKDVAREKEIIILQDDKNTVWRADTGDFFTSVVSDQNMEYDLALPVMKTGYLPVFSLESAQDGNRFSSRLRAQILGTEDLQEDLINLQASLLSFPVTWPADCQSLLSLSLTGGLLPNIGFSVYLASEENGHTRLEVRKPTVDYEPGPVMLTLEGNLNPIDGEFTMLSFNLDDLDGALDLLVANDAAIRAFLPDLVQPMLEGILHFLVGIPTSACQTIMDDLTDLGVLDLVLGE